MNCCATWGCNSISGRCFPRFCTVKTGHIWECTGSVWTNKKNKNLLIQINVLTKPKWGNLEWRIGPLQTASHVRLDLWRKVDEERLEGADLGTATQLFPLYVRARPPQPPDVYHQPSCFLSLPFFLPVSPSQIFSLRVSLKQALPVIMHTQFTRGLWSKWNVSSHMIVRTVYSYSTEKAKQRKRRRRLLDCSQSFRCGFLNVNYAFASLLHACVCVYLCIYVVSTWACVCICSTKRQSETLGDRW